MAARPSSVKSIPVAALWSAFVVVSNLPVALAMKCTIAGNSFDQTGLTTFCGGRLQLVASTHTGAVGTVAACNSLHKN